LEAKLVVVEKSSVVIDKQLQNNKEAILEGLSEISADDDFVID
ncbi:11394_t:CDS:1, partial [Funneliformis caledonium]